MTIIPGLDFFTLGNTSAISTDINQYHFIGVDGGNTRLYTIESSLGGLMANPIITDNIVGIESYCGDTSLYALRENGNNYDLVEIEALTGTITSIGPIPNVDAYVSETFVLAQSHGLYTFVALDGGNYYLRSYRITDATLVYDHPFPDNLVGYEYNCSDSTIYALWEDGPQYKLEKVHMYNGTHSTVAVLNGITPGYVGESSSIKQGGYYTYRGFNANNDFALITIHVQNGTIIYNSTTIDNAIGFEEAMCCIGQTVSINEVDKDQYFSLFPNPAFDQLSIEADEPILTIQIFDTKGVLIMKRDLASKQKNYRIDLNGFSVGSYIVVAKTESAVLRSSFTKSR